MNQTRMHYWKACIGMLLAAVFVASTVGRVAAANVIISWDPNDPQPDGYRVFAREAGEAYDYNRPAWEGNAATCTLTDLQDQTIHCFVVRARLGDIESGDSNEVCYIPPDSDNDGDGMPDEWELEFGLDPLTHDADDDADSDGISNRDEFRAGIDPTHTGEGRGPHPPIALFPEGDTEVELEPLLEVDEFKDGDEDVHLATQWQLYDASTLTCLMDVVSESRLTLLQVPLLLLGGGHTYHWRARFFDDAGGASDWSMQSVFSTQAVVDDLEGDTVPDDQAEPVLQVDVGRSLVSPAAYSEPTAITVESTDTVFAIERVVLVDPLDFVTDETTPSPLPSAVVAYKLVLHQSAQKARVTIHLSDPAPPGSTWIGYDAVIGWRTYGEKATLSSDRQSVTIEAQDGGYGDADGIANGIILNAAGLQSTTAETPPSTGNDDAVDSRGGSGGGGGCFIASGHVPRKRLKKGLYGWERIKHWLRRLNGFERVSTDASTPPNGAVR